MDYEGMFAWKLAALGGVLDFFVWDGTLHWNGAWGNPGRRNKKIPTCYIQKLYSFLEPSI